MTVASLRLLCSIVYTTLFMLVFMFLLLFFIKLPNIRLLRLSMYQYIVHEKQIALLSRYELFLPLQNKNNLVFSK